MKIALDTNILAYASGADNKQLETLQILSSLLATDIVLPAQCLGELYNVLVRKKNIPVAITQQIIMEWARLFPALGSSWQSFQTAMEIAAIHHLQIWDALVLAIAAENHCHVLLSEDMHHGFTWGNLTVLNPFRKPSHPLLAPFLTP